MVRQNSFILERNKSNLPPHELVNESGLPPSTMKPGMESPSTIQTGQITPWLVLLVIFADMEGGPHLSSSPLSLRLSSPASIPAAPPHFSPACSPSRWTAGASVAAACQGAALDRRSSPSPPFPPPPPPLPPPAVVDSSSPVSPSPIPHAGSSSSLSPTGSCAQSPLSHPAGPFPAELAVRRRVSSSRRPSATVPRRPLLG